MTVENHSWQDRERSFARNAERKDRHEEGRQRN